VFGSFFRTKKNENSESSLKRDRIEHEENKSAMTNILETFSLLKDSSFLIFAIANFLVR
jgi:hypothetical protein